ncbi:MAG: IPT/TIG domain-containing protein [Bryobacteraceae bacterium]
MSRAASLLLCSAICALAQTTEVSGNLRAVRPMALLESRYEIRAGEPARIAAPAETLDFLLHAKTRRASIAGMETSGLVVGPGYTPDQILLAPSPRAKPGEYTVTLSATSETGEERQTTLAVVVKPQATVPPSATRPPVVLLNGWLTGFTNSCPIATTSADTFGNLTPYLVSDGVPVVYLFDNCAVDPGNTIEALGADLGAFLNTIKYDSGAQVPQIDLVAHSMGGLIARAYLAGIQPNQTFLPPAPTLVRKLVLIATPNFGSFVAGNYVNSIVAGSQSAELAPGSELLWNLATWNQYYDDLRGVDAIAVIGNAGSYIPNLSSSNMNNNASDGLVTLTSASLGFAYPRQSFPTRVVPYCHIDPSAYTNPLWGASACNAPGIANVTDTSHPTGQIVRSFLAGTTAWSSIGNPAASDPYLAKYGGMFFALVNSAGNYVSDMSAVSWGTVPLENGGDIDTIFYVDLASGTGTLTATSQSLGAVSFNSLALALGYTSAVRGKMGATVSSVTPLASKSPQVLAAGTTVTLNGANLGSQCSGCQVLAYPAGSGTAQALTVTSWQNAAISVKLPANLTGLLTLKVLAAAASGTDTIGIMVAAPSTIAVVPASLHFTYTAGGTVPSAQPIQISNSGTGTAALSWTAKASDSWLSVSAASGTAPSTPSVSVSPAALSAGTYNGSIQISAAGASNSPVSVAVTLTVAPAAPAVTVTAVVNAGSYQPGIASGTWISIFGTNLSQSTYLWQASDIVNGALPTSLQGVSVTVNGLPAYVDYISPTQINALAPDDDTLGPVPVQVTTAGETSNAVTVQKSLFAPAFLTFDGTHVAALHADYSLVGAPNLLPGAVTTPAQPGEIILLYGVGFGPANPPQPSGQLVTTATPPANAVQITIGGVAASAAYAGLVESGLYQFNVTAPNLPSGDAAVVATIGGVSTQTGVLLTIQR